MNRWGNSLRSWANRWVRSLGYFLAWNFPRSYLVLTVRWKLRRSPYYKLVEACRAEPPQIPNSRSHARTPITVKPRRILYCIYWYDLGGAEAYALYTIRTARELGHACYCISTVPSENPEFPVFAAHCVEALEYPGEDAAGSFSRFVSEYIRKNAIDVLHIHHSAMMYEVLPAIRELFPHLLIVDSTHIVEYRDGGFPQFSARFSDFIDRHNVISRNLIRVQQVLYERLSGRELSTEKFHLTYLSSLTKPAGISPLSLERTRKVVTFYGRLVQQKQPNIFIAITERLMERYPSIDLEAHIYGDGELRSALEARIARSRFSKRIRYLGRCDDQSEVFNTTDILLLTSLNEGLSLTSFEALTHDRLVVSSDVGAQGELLSSGCRIPLTSEFIEKAASRIKGFLIDPDQYLAELRESQRNLERLRAHETNPAAIAQLYAGHQ